MTFSYSRVSCFGNCRYQWLLKYIYECEDKEMFYASYGSFIHKIFERFYKIDESRNRNENRYGLGLAIAKDIVEKHNAKISANSKKGITTFKVTF